MRYGTGWSLDKDTTTTTFICEACLQRFDKEKLYKGESLQHNVPHSTRFIRGQRIHVMASMVCSEECYKKAPIHRLNKWYMYTYGERGKYFYNQLVHNRG